MKNKLLAVLMFIFLIIGFLVTSTFSTDVAMMTKEELKATLGNPDFVIFDVRLGSDFFSSDLMIKGAIRPDMGQYISNVAQTYPKGKTFVFYCASPYEERSRINLETLLKFGGEGYNKGYVLKGGWEEWLKSGYPTEKK